MTTLVLRGLGELRRRTDALLSVWTMIVLVPLTVATLDPGRVGAVLEIASTALLGTLPYIASAVALIAWMKAAGAESVVARAFEGRETRMILLAALLGGLAPFCSCEVIPFVAGLLAVGAPLSAVMAFWLSSPLVDPPTLLITAGALGWDFAIGKTVAAVLVGLMGGFTVRLLRRLGVFDQPLRRRSGGGCGCAASPFRGTPRWRFWRESGRAETFMREARGNAVFLLKWLTLAYLLEGLIVTYVPAEAIATLVGGDGIVPVLAGALVGAPAYVNSYAAPALVAGLVEQGMTAGAAMAFMIAGAVSSVPAMAAVWSLVRPQVFASYLGLGIGGAVLGGLLFDLLV